MKTLEERAEEIVNQIYLDVLDRRGIKWEFQKIDEDAKLEILKSWTAIAIGTLKQVEAETRQAVMGERVALQTLTSGSSFGEMRYQLGLYEEKIPLVENVSRRDWQEAWHKCFEWCAANMKLQPAGPLEGTLTAHQRGYLLGRKTAMAENERWLLTPEPQQLVMPDESEVTKAACEKYFAAVRQDGESDTEGTARIFMVRIAFEAGAEWFRSQIEKTKNES